MCMMHIFVIFVIFSFSYIILLFLIYLFILILYIRATVMTQFPFKYFWFCSPHAVCCFVFQQFIGQVMSVERTDAQGPAGVKLTMARTSIKTGQDEMGPTTQDPEYFSTVSVKDWCSIQALYIVIDALFYLIDLNVLKTKQRSQHINMIIMNSLFLIASHSYTQSVDTEVFLLDFGSKCRHEVTPVPPYTHTHRHRHSRKLTGLCGLTCLISASLMNSTTGNLHVC